MATVLTFPERRVGDWTDVERARLAELATTFAREAGVEVVYGVTDAGDPWCVVLDANEEVLVHVARVNGTFLAHDLKGEAFAEARDLRDVVASVVGPRWQEERQDVVVPFASSARHAQVVTAVLVVAAFVDHHRAEATPVDEWSLATIRLTRSSAAGSKDGQREEAGKVALLTADGGKFDLGVLAPVQDGGRDLLATADRAPLSIDVKATHLAETESKAGSPGLASILLGQVQADEVTEPPARMAVGDGPDQLGHPGTTPTETRLMRGGDGDDLLLIDGGAIAVGGHGSDTFVVAAPVAGSQASLLGIILDFEPGQDTIRIVGLPEFAGITQAPVTTVGVELSAPDLDGVSIAAVRIGIDVDGDGQEDGYLLVANGAPVDQGPFDRSDGSAPEPLSIEIAAPAAMLQPADHIA